MIRRAVPLGSQRSPSPGRARPAVVVSASVGSTLVPRFSAQRAKSSSCLRVIASNTPAAALEYPTGRSAAGHNIGHTRLTCCGAVERDPAALVRLRVLDRGRAALGVDAVSDGQHAYPEIEVLPTQGEYR